MICVVNHSVLTVIRASTGSFGGSMNADPAAWPGPYVVASHDGP